MQKIKRNIPNAITCGNLFCGCLAIVKAFEGDLVWTAYLVGIAVVLDFFDGFTARMLHVSSAIGKDLDSLADMVTFGVVPGILLFQLIKGTLFTFYTQRYTIIPNDSTVFPKYYYIAPYIGFLVTIFSAIRLAKFNNDSRQTNSFIGLPTPANAIFFCSIPLIAQQLNLKYEVEKNPFEMLAEVSGNPVLSIINNPFILISLTVIFSFILIAELPLFALKFKSFGWKGNEIRFSFLLFSIGLLVAFQFLGIPLIIILYIFMSVVNNFMNRSKKSVE